MEPLIRVKADTPLRDILDAYPWLPEELIRLEPGFRIIRSPLMQALIRRSTVADAADRASAESCIYAFKKDNNLEHLCDAANYLMFRFKYPMPGDHYTPTGSDDSVPPVGTPINMEKEY